MDDESDARRDDFIDDLASQIMIEADQERQQLIQEARMQIKVFLCHASEDKETAMGIYQRLKEEGFKPWIDKEDLLPGQKWREEIPKAIRSSDFALVLLSERSVSKRGYVQREFKLALDELMEMPSHEIFAIPVRLDNCEIPDQFASLHCVDYFKPDAMERIITSITKYSTKPSSNTDSQPDALELIDSFPKNNEYITVDQIEDIFLQFNKSIDENSAKYIVTKFRGKTSVQWDTSDFIEFLDDNTKLVWHPSDRLFHKPGHFVVPSEAIDYPVFEIHVGRGSSDSSLKGVDGSELPFTVIKVKLAQ